MFICADNLFFNLSEVTTIAALVVLVIQGLTHVGHLLHIKKTGANFYLVLGAALGMFVVAGLTLYYNSIHGMPLIGLYIFGAFILALLIEIVLRMTTKRVIKIQTDQKLLAKFENRVKEKFEKVLGES